MSGAFTTGGAREPLATASQHGMQSAADKATLDALAALGLATIVTAPATDANSWVVQRLPSGKRLWNRRWLAVATDASPFQTVVGSAALPVGVSTMAAVDIDYCGVRAASFAGAIVANVTGGEASTACSVEMGSTDGSDLSALVASVDVFVTLRER